MPRQQVLLENGEIYHICLRAVGDAEIFKDENDHYRGIFSIYEFNNDGPVSIWWRRQQRKKEKLAQLTEILQAPSLQNLNDTRDCLVQILAFCFMPNHIHLVLKQLKDNGISLFMQKTGGGLAMYFNNKYHRKGHLFNQFKAFYIESDDQLKNVINYVHCNPISLIEPGWKEKGIKNPEKVKRFLGQEYRWSSYFDYVGKKNFPSITSRDFISDVMGGPDGVKKEAEDWISYKATMRKFNYHVLE